jgi:hypothetical protein
MEVDNYWLLLHDKCTILLNKADHSYTNKNVINVGLNEILSMDSIELTGKSAIDEYNKFNLNPKIPKDLDENMYTVTIYTSHFGNNITNLVKYTVIGVDYRKLQEIILNKQDIPNKEFLKSVARNHLFYTKAQQSGQIANKEDFQTIKTNSEQIVNKLENIIYSPSFSFIIYTSIRVIWWISALLVNIYALLVSIILPKMI